VTITGVTTTQEEGTSVGYHVMADVAVFFSRSIGVGAGVRYSRGDFKLDAGSGATTEGKAGGVQALAGLRVRF
jgi:opacity protein-like surface antigen